MVVAMGMLVLAALSALNGAQASSQRPTTLVMAVADTGGPPTAGETFVNAVRRISKGRLLIAVQLPAQQTADGESAVIREVEQGTPPIGWIPTRAWDAVGSSTFAALQAPFLISNYAVLQMVLQDPVALGMVAGTRPSGVRTLGLAAVDLHVPLGARRPFVSPSDFAGATLRIPSNSRLTASILAALGATSASIASGADLIGALTSGTVDGAVTSPGYVLQNGYYGAAKYLTANLVFFPYVGSIGINEKAFEALSSSQRSVLTEAAAEMTRNSFAGIRARDQLQLRLLCTAGMKVATSSATQLATLRRAERSIYASLESNHATALRIARIQALKQKIKPTPPLEIPLGCAA